MHYAEQAVAAPVHSQAVEGGLHVNGGDASTAVGHKAVCVSRVLCRSPARLRGEHGPWSRQEEGCHRNIIAVDPSTDAWLAAVE